ncbi:MAG: hypothetical protein ACFE9L_16130 [Candidatus Hodarchaeota archaeon]
MSTPCYIVPTKTLDPIEPGYIDTSEGVVQQVARVGGADSVPVEIKIEAVRGSNVFGIDLVFLIDNSGSMGPDPPQSDPTIAPEYTIIESTSSLCHQAFSNRIFYSTI